MQEKRKPNSENPNHSPSIQFALDCKTCKLEHFTPELEKEIRQKHPILDETWRKHQYPTEALVFSQVTREHEVFSNLPKFEKTYGFRAVTLLNIIIQNMGTSLNFSIARQDVMEILDCSKNTARNTIQVLTRWGIIAVLREAKGRGNPTIYMMNPMVANVGKKKSKNDQDLFWELAGEVAFRKFIEIAEKTITVDEVKTDEKIRFVAIRPKRPGEEEAEKTEMTKKQTKKESIQGLSAEQIQAIDSIF